MKDEVKVVSEEPVGNSTVEKEFLGADEIFFAPISKSISLPKSSVKLATPQSIRSNGCVLPPYNPSQILAYKAIDITYQTCIAIKVDTAIGRGYSFGYKDIDKHKDIIDFFKTPNRNFSDTFTSILKNMYTDFELFDNCFLEFVKSGNKRSLYSLPGKDMYIKPKVDKFGNTLREIDKYMYIPDGCSSPTVFEPYPVSSKTKDGVHYCLHMKRPSQENLYYGKPDTSHLFDLIKQSYLTDQYNINFFSNGGQPAWAVLITGGKLAKKSYEKIKEFIENNLKGVANSHKMLFLSVPNEKAQIKLVPLSKSIDEQFITLADKIQFKIALKCRVHPKLLGLSQGGNFGGGSAGITDLKLFMETVSQPEQKTIADFINRFLELEFGVNCEFSLNGMNISNEKDDAIIANMYYNMVDEFGNRVLSVNEIRQMFLHLKPIDLKDTPQDESETERMSNLSVKPNKDGDLHTSDNSDLGQGDGQASNNLDPNKNNDESTTRL
ncbi:MAG: phage portal protein [Methanolobus sp.]|nr:phage portal protein [Methanolobus sp.]